MSSRAEGPQRRDGELEYPARKTARQDRSADPTASASTPARSCPRLPSPAAADRSRPPMRNGPPASYNHLAIFGGEISEGSRPTGPRRTPPGPTQPAPSFGAVPGAGRLRRYSRTDGDARDGGIRAAPGRRRRPAIGRRSSVAVFDILPHSSIIDGEGGNPAPAVAHRSRRRGRGRGGRGKGSGRDGR